MKTYLIEYHTNYGVGAMAVNADSKKEAITLARNAGAWDNATATEVDTSKRGVVAEAIPSGG